MGNPVSDAVERKRKKRAHCLYKTANRCAYCGNPLTEETMTIDHIIPVSRGGSNHTRNLAACCPACNQRKNDSPEEEWN